MRHKTLLAARVLLGCALLLALSGSAARAQFGEPTVFEDAPSAYWIAPPDVPGDAFSVFHVRKSFVLDARPEQFIGPRPHDHARAARTHPVGFPAWSAHPNYGLLATVLGIRPAEPGFRSVRIRPALGDLERVEGVMPHERGPISVQLQRTSERGNRATITLPEELTGTFEWEWRQTPLHSGTQEITY
jgi:hypothetical protein